MLCVRYVKSQLYDITSVNLSGNDRRHRHARHSPPQSPASFPPSAPPPSIPCRPCALSKAQADSRGEPHGKKKRDQTCQIAPKRPFVFCHFSRCKGKYPSPFRIFGSIACSPFRYFQAPCAVIVLKRCTRMSEHWRECATLYAIQTRLRATL